jgi:sugar phosphate isomerase/epimerase
MKYAITQWSYPGNGIYAIRFAAQAGYDGIQIELGDYTNGYYMKNREMQQVYKEETEKHGLEIISIVLNDVMRRGFLGPKDGDDYKIAMGSIDMILEVASAMKLNSVMVPSFGVSKICNRDDFNRTVEVLKDTCVKAEKYGINIESETSLAAEMQIDLMKQVDMPNLSTFFDTQNLQWNDGLSQTENLVKLLPYLCKQIHLCDGWGNRENGGPNGGAILGTGSAEFFEQMKILGESHFDGWLITENIYWKKSLYDLGNPYELSKKDLEIVKKAVAEWKN